MSELKDKIEGKAQEIKGKVTDNERDEAEGKAKQMRGDVKGAANDAKSKVQRAGDSLK